MDLGEILKYIQRKMNKDNSGNIMNPDVYNSFLQAVNITLFNVKAGLPENYAPGQPLPPQAIDVTQQVSEDLRFALVRKGGTTPVLKVINGYATIPSDFVRLSSIRYKYTAHGKMRPKPVEILFENEWGMRVGSEINQPKLSRPICKFGSHTIEFAPAEITKVDFNYYRIPNQPVFDFTYDGLDNPVYLPPGGVHDGTNLPAGTPSRSVELEWPETVHVKFANMLISEFSVSIRDQFTYQDSEKVKQTGT